MNRTLTALFISVDKHITGLFTIDCGTYNTPDMKPLETIHLQGLTAAQTYAEACKINEKWSTTGQVIPYLQKEAELPILKERAAATALATTQQRKPFTNQSIAFPPGKCKNVFLAIDI